MRRFGARRVGSYRERMARKQFERTRPVREAMQRIKDDEQAKKKQEAKPNDR